MAKKETPKVFISSTVEDLKPFRKMAARAANRAKFVPKMMEYEGASSVKPPLHTCMGWIDEVDVLIVIVANRYGWIPEDQPENGTKSITWLECLRALQPENEDDKKEVLAFLLDPAVEWPEKFDETFRLTDAIKKGNYTSELADQVNEAVKQLGAFRTWIKEHCVYKTFQNPDNLETEVLQSLIDWRSKHSQFVTQVQPGANTIHYLKWLNADCANIDIRGLRTGSERAHNFGIEELYIPLKTMQKAGERQAEKASAGEKIELFHVLVNRLAAIIGDPGAGKTTFLRRLCFVLTQSLLDIEPDAALDRLQLETTPFPIFIRLGELAEHIRMFRGRAETWPEDSPRWMAHFMAEKSEQLSWTLDVHFFQNLFDKKGGEVLFLLDGLDEAPERRVREVIGRLVSNAVKVYAPNAFVLTSRPSLLGRARPQDAGAGPRTVFMARRPQSAVCQKTGRRNPAGRISGCE